LNDVTSPILGAGDGRGVAVDPYDDEVQDEDEEWDYLGDGYYSQEVYLPYLNVS
jgi:hypothetical protein